MVSFSVIRTGEYLFFCPFSEAEPQYWSWRKVHAIEFPANELYLNYGEP